MNCKNCNLAMGGGSVAGWCALCVGALIGREEVARSSGWRALFLRWLDETAPPGRALSIGYDCLRLGFGAGWGARGLAVSPKGYTADEPIPHGAFYVGIWDNTNPKGESNMGVSANPDMEHSTDRFEGIRYTDEDAAALAELTVARANSRTAEIYRAFAEFVCYNQPDEYAPRFEVMEQSFIAGWNARADAGAPEGKS